MGNTVEFEEARSVARLIHSADWGWEVQTTNRSSRAFWPSCWEKTRLSKHSCLVPQTGKVPILGPIYSFSRCCGGGLRLNLVRRWRTEGPACWKLTASDETHAVTTACPSHGHLIRFLRAT